MRRGKTIIICIMCPLACHVVVTGNDAGNILGVANHRCEEGRKYAIAEYRLPARVLTTTILTEAASQPLLPVRSSKAIPKTRLMEVMHFLSKIRVKHPVEMGQEIVPDILGTGADIVATGTL